MEHNKKINLLEENPLFIGLQPINIRNGFNTPNSRQ
jgi:hypothetical protein